MKEKASNNTSSNALRTKFLLIYVILKLKLMKGKVIVFVQDIDRRMTYCARSLNVVDVLETQAHGGGS